MSSWKQQAARTVAAAGVWLVLLAATGCEIKPVVDVYPRQVTVHTQGTQQFSGVIGGLADAWVTYEVQEGPTGGSIDERGLYTAPASQGTFHVRVTSVADPTRTALATVQVIPPPPVAVEVIPSYARVIGGGRVQFTALVSNTGNTAVTWTVVETTPEAGSIDNLGTYTAAPQGGTFQVRATSVADPTRSATAQVEVVPALHGIRNLYYATEGGVETRPADLRGTSLSALVPDGMGGYAERQAVGSEDGTFYIPDVPEDFYYLQYQPNRYLHSTSRYLDLSEYVVGRPDVVAPEPGTTVSVSLEGLAPWEAFPYPNPLAFTSAGAGVGYTNLDYAGVYPEASATTLNATVDYLQMISLNRGRGLVESGDDLVIHQLEHLTPVGEIDEVYAATRSLRFTGVQMANGGNTPLAGTLTPLPLNPVDVTFSQSDFQYQSSLVNPSSTPDVMFVGIESVPPSDGARRVQPTGAELFWASFTPWTWADQPVQYSYGNPFGWEEELYWGALFGREYLSPSNSSATPRRFHASLWYSTPNYPGSQSQYLSVSMEPVSSPSIDGYSFHWDTSVSSAPVISWYPPYRNIAYLYEVTIWRLGVDESLRTSRTLVAGLRTAGTWLPVPRGMLRAGEQYMFSIRAFYGLRELTQPYLYSSPFGVADTLSGVVYVY